MNLPRINTRDPIPIPELGYDQRLYAPGYVPSVIERQDESRKRWAHARLTTDWGRSEYERRWGVAAADAMQTIRNAAERHAETEMVLAMHALSAALWRDKRNVFYGDRQR